MHNHPSSADLVARPPARLMERFAAECGLRGPLRFLIENVETGRTGRLDVYEPFILVGRSAECQLRLPHPEVSYRHVYLQVVEGRLFAFDLEGTGEVFWGDGNRRQGPVTADTRLQVGPFMIRLSRAPAYASSLNQTGEDDLQNEPLENSRLMIENGTGRNSHDPLRPLRRCVTILGRGPRCHLRLSDSSVSKAHCSLVRTASGFWVVDLLGRDGTSVNDRRVRFAPLPAQERLTVGRFRMRVWDLNSMDCDVVPVSDPGKRPSTADQIEGVLSRRTPTTPASTPEQPRPVRAFVQTRQILTAPAEGLMQMSEQVGTPESLLIAMMEQFGQMQQQLLNHTQQQMAMLSEMFATLHKAQNDAVMEQLNRIHEITAELAKLRTEQVITSTRGSGPPAAARAPLKPIRKPSPEASTQSATGEKEGQPSPNEPPADTASDSSAPKRYESGRPAAAGARQDAGTHEWVTLRISELERERNSRWKRLLQLVARDEEA